MKRLIYVFILVAAAGCSGREEVPPDLEELAGIRGLKDYFIGDFRCGVFVPPSYDSTRQYPLVLRLHGMGDTTSWQLPYYREPVVSLDPVFVLTPKCPPGDEAGWGNSWEQDLSPMMARAFEVYDLVSEVFNIDPARVYVCGSSMGGFGSYAAIRHEPDLFAACYVECGGGDTAMAGIIDRIPFWMFHGEVDDVVPVSFSRDMYQAVKRIGGDQLRYTEYPGVGHNVWDNTNEEGTITTWLLAQQKGSEHHPPERKLNPQASLEQEGVLLTWEAEVTFPAGDDDIWYVDIFRDGALLTEINSDSTSVLDTGIAAGNTYEYVFKPVSYYFLKGQPEVLRIEVP